MEAEDYDRWYATPRGLWIGNCEIDLLYKGLCPRPGDSVLDVGCGTGFFTRAFANLTAGKVIGVDIDTEYVEHACRRDTAGSYYAVADGRSLPFRNASFDLVISIAALCFIDEPIKAVCEMIRVTRRRVAVGLLNRNSLLWMQKGRHGGRGGYQGAQWHTVREAKSMFEGLPVRNICVRTAIHFPNGGAIAEHLERILPSTFPIGSFILVSGDVT
jgi:SAM-dependent methyltransferase